MRLIEAGRNACVSRNLSECKARLFLVVSVSERMVAAIAANVVGFWAMWVYVADVVKRVLGNEWRGEEQAPKKAEGAVRRNDE